MNKRGTSTNPIRWRSIRGPFRRIAIFRGRGPLAGLSLRSSHSVPHRRSPTHPAEPRVRAIVRFRATWVVRTNRPTKRICRFRFWCRSIRINNPSAMSFTCRRLSWRRRDQHRTMRHSIDRSPTRIYRRCRSRRRDTDWGIEPFAATIDSRPFRQAAGRIRGRFRSIDCAAPIVIGLAGSSPTQCYFRRMCEELNRRSGSNRHRHDLINRPVRCVGHCVWNRTTEPVKRVCWVYPNWFTRPPAER